MSEWETEKPTGLLVTQNGTLIYGKGIGASGYAVGEVCFNTAMTGYQEIITDPSYASQIITFTFPHIGNVGANAEDIETPAPPANNANKATTSHKPLAIATQGIIIREMITEPANYRAIKGAGGHLNEWLKQHGLIGLAGVDTRALTRHIREHGMFNATIAHAPDGQFDIDALQAAAKQFPGLEGLDLAARVTTAQTYNWSQNRWQWKGAEETAGVGAGEKIETKAKAKIETGAQPPSAKRPKVIAIDYGIKQNILCCLATVDCDISIVPADMSARAILAMQPDGTFLSNGPGDPAATATYAVPEIKELIASGTPIFGICLGHQLLALALGAQTEKMPQGHHGANHHVKDLRTGKVEITSMNHGFTVSRKSLPLNVEETHISLFDGTNCGIRLRDKPVFSVQYHPEASPGPQDSHYLFDHFITAIEQAKSK